MCNGCIIVVDYDATAAAEQLLLYLVSEQASPIRDIMSVQLLDIMDKLGADMLDYTLNITTSSSTLPLLAQRVGPNLLQGMGKEFSISNTLQILLDSTTTVAPPSEPLRNAVSTLSTISSTRGIDVEKLNSVLKKVHNSFEFIIVMLIFFYEFELGSQRACGASLYVKISKQLIRAGCC